MTWKRAFALGGILTMAVVLFCRSTAYALEEDEVVSILVNNESLFESNTIWGNILRYIGWGVTKGLAAVGKAAAGLYDTCFGFVDFTTFPEVSAFIDKWKPVFIALVCLSLLLIGILLCVGWEKKPKIVINLLIAVTVATSSTWVIKEMNSFISTGIRNEILEGEGGSSVVYNIVGANIHDLVYLDNTVGLENLNKTENADKVYGKFTAEQFRNISINETVEPDDVSEEAEKIMANGIQSEIVDNDKVKYSLDELYDGVAWTDLLNEYYYRYTVSWGAMWMELFSLAIIYLFMSYKVIRFLYEMVVHQLLAYLYAANLNNNQKILKILDSLKDSYILLLMTTVLIKFYLLACRFITSWDVSGLSKGFILLFLAFAVIDGPNLIQRLTGTDIGASDTMGKIMMLFYGGQMLKGVSGGLLNKASGIAGFTGRTIKGAIRKGKEIYKGFSGFASAGEGRGSSSMEDMEKDVGGGSSETRGDQSTDGNGPEDSRNPGFRQGGNNPEHSHNDPPFMSGTKKDGMQEGDTGRREDPSRDQEASGGDHETVFSIPPWQRNQENTSYSEQENGSGTSSMDDIGKGMKNKNNVPDGFQKERKENGDMDRISRMMDSMEQDVSSSLEGSMNAGQQGETAGRPLDTGGNIFKEHTDSSELAGYTDGSGMLSGVEGKKESRRSILEENRNGEP